MASGLKSDVPAIAAIVGSEISRFREREVEGREW